MAWETRIGLLVGLAFIICFAVILSRHNTQPAKDSFAGSHWVDRVEDAPAPTTRIERAARRVVYPETPEVIPPATIQNDPGFERIQEDHPSDTSELESIFDPQLLADAVQSGIERWMASDVDATAVEPEPVVASADTPTDAPLILAATSKPADPVWSEPEPSEQRKYKVKKNDSLYKIAMNEYGKAGQKLIQQLYEANKHQMASPGNLKVGQVLVLPELNGTPIRQVSTFQPETAKSVEDTIEKSARSAESNKVKDSASKKTTPNWRWYDVKKGDILGVIAQRELGSSKRWKEIYELNKDRFPDPQKIQWGVRIKVPITGDQEA